MTYLRTGLSLSATLALSVSSLSPAFAQEGPGFVGTLSYSQGFEISDNEDLDSSTSGATFTSRTGVRFAAESETRAETLRFNLGTELVGDYGGGADDSFDFENSEAFIEYARRGASAALSFSASYRNIQLDEETDIITSGPSAGTLILSTGVLDTTALRASVQTGIDAPFGVDVSAEWVDRNYSDTTDPDLVDSTTISLDALARFRITPALTARFLAGTSEESESGAGGVDTTDSYVGVGVGGETAGGLSFTGDVIYDWTDETGGASDDGIGIEVSVTQDRPAGSLGFDISSRIDSDGRRSEAAVRQSFDLRNGVLEYSLGVVDQDGFSSVRPSASLLYRQETPRGALTASLAHDPVADDGDLFVNTELEVGFEQSINAVSGWSAGLTYAAANQVGGVDDDSRTSANISYSRSLTEEWRMRTGLEHIREIEGGGPTESSNTVFFNIERDITFGF